MNKMDDFEEFKESARNDREEIGELVIEKIMIVFQNEINEYIASLIGLDQMEIYYKALSMCDFLNESLYVNLLLNIARNYKVNPSTLFNDGKSIKESIKKFEEKNEK